MDESAMQRNATEARVAWVGTVDEPGRVHLVPRAGPASNRFRPAGS